MKVVLAALNAKYVHSNLAVCSLEAFARERWRREYGEELPFALAVREYTINHNLDRILQSLYREAVDPASGAGTEKTAISRNARFGSLVKTVSGVMAGENGTVSCMEAGNGSIVAFSCYIWNRAEILSLARELKKVAPGISIWLGGPEVSYDSAKVLEECPSVDGIMQGEGEETFYELVKAFANRESVIGRNGNGQDISGGAAGPGSGDETGREEAGSGDGTGGEEAGSGDGTGREEAGSGDGTGRKEAGSGNGGGAGKAQAGEGVVLLAKIRGIVYRAADGSIVENPPRPLLPLDALPFIYSDLSGFANKILYYETSRGCPFSCSYCLSSIDKSVRFRSLSLVKEELSFFLQNRVRQVKFIDRTFNCDRRRALAIWSFVQEYDNGVTNFHFEIAADLIGEEELAVFSKMRPGLIQLEIGLQTTNPESIREIRRVMDIEKLKRNMLAVRRMGNIHQHLDLIAGLPFEDYASFVESFNAACTMRPNQLQLGFLKVLKGSYMEKMAEEYGLVYRGEQPYEVLSTRWISYGELLKLKQVEEMVEAYYNSDQFEHVLPYMEQFFETPFAMYECLGAYYEAHGLSEIGCRREARYEALRECFLEHLRGMAQMEEEPVSGMRGGADMRVFDSLLTFDYYLRENAKSRPSWRQEALIGKEEYVRFFRSGGTEELPLGGEGYDSRAAARGMHIEPVAAEAAGWIMGSGTGRTPEQTGGDAAAVPGGKCDRMNGKGGRADRCAEKALAGTADRDKTRVGKSVAGKAVAEKAEEAQLYAVFDYEQRNALTGDAAFTLISHL